jgi:hypothetical protein
MPTLLAHEQRAINVTQLLQGDELASFLADHSERTRSEEGMRELLQAAQRDSAAYFGSYIQKTGKGKKK